MSICSPGYPDPKTCIYAEFADPLNPELQEKETNTAIITTLK
jgi:hypothetical protein